MTGKVCPVHRCGAVIGSHEHLCHRHWLRVPRRLARRVVSAYAELRRGGPATAAAAMYRESIDEAVALLGDGHE